MRKSRLNNTDHERQLAMEEEYDMNTAFAIRRKLMVINETIMAQGAKYTPFESGKPIKERAHFEPMLNYCAIL